jgi:Domain of unknown function (DUF397)
MLDPAEVDSLRWEAPPRCDNSSGNCPEIADIGDGGYAIRNSNLPYNVVTFDRGDWLALTVSLRLDDYGQ